MTTKNQETVKQVWKLKMDNDNINGGADINVRRGYKRCIRMRNGPGEVH